MRLSGPVLSILIYKTMPYSIQVTLLTAVILCGVHGVGCSTARKAGDQEWIDLFSPPSNDASSAGADDYSAERVDEDYRALIGLQRELESLANEMVRMRRSLTYTETPYFSDVENKQIEALLFRFANARDSLAEMVSFYRKGFSSDPEVHTKGAVLGMSAGLTSTYHSSRFIALFHRHKKLIKLFNAPHHRYEIPAGMYDMVFKSETSLDRLELLDVAWYLFSRALADPASTLSALGDADQDYRVLIEAMDGLHADTHIQTEYVLNARRRAVSGAENRLRHTRIAGLMSSARGGISGGLYKTRGVIFRDVARIKKPRSQLLAFSTEQISQIHAALEPGDILLTYTAGYMSNVFLPGKFKHGITYIGNVEDRRRVGLTDEFLQASAVSEDQSRRLIECVNKETSAQGETLDVIEAVAEGVVQHSLETILETHINRLVVLRPRFTAMERRDHLLAQLQYIGNGYDFKFDFQDDTYQCCTELIYRTTHKKGSIDYRLIKMKAMWILAADDILRYYLDLNPEAFDLILLADQGPVADDFSAHIYYGAEALERLSELMGVGATASSEAPQ